MDLPRDDRRSGPIVNRGYVPGRRTQTSVLFQPASLEWALAMVMTAPNDRHFVSFRVIKQDGLFALFMETYFGN